MLSITRALLSFVAIATTVLLLQQFSVIDPDVIKSGFLVPMAHFFPCASQSSNSPTITELLRSDNAAWRQFTAWLTAFNTQDRDTLLAYHNTYFPYDVASSDVENIGRELALSQATGGFSIVDVLTPSDTDMRLTVLLHEKNRPQYACSMIQVDPHKYGNPVTKFEIHPTTTPIEFVPDDRKEEYQRALQPLTPYLRCSIVNEISGVIREHYIFPDVGEKMIRHLETSIQDDGEYNNYQDAESFARRLTDDLRAVSRDKHTLVLFHEPPLNIKNIENDVKKPIEFFDLVRKRNFGFGNTSIETINDKKIGFLPIHSFVPSSPERISDYADIREAISGIISEVSNTDALLVDLRLNGGGDPATVAFVLSYLLDDGPVHLLDMVDRNGTVQESFSTLPVSELPDGAARFGGSKPLFVLTSKSTISGGEDMAYALQAFKRANAIIGEHDTTAGAANPSTNPKFIGEEEFGKGWWFVGIPNWRPVNIITGSNWEVVGVKSDVIVREGKGDAKDVGTRMALKVLGLEEGLLVQQGPREN
jgi:hypothetical protein